MHPEQIRIFKNMTPAEKLALAARFYFASRELKLKSLKSLHPDLPDHKIQKMLRDLFLYAAN